MFKTSDEAFPTIQSDSDQSDWRESFGKDEAERRLWKNGAQACLQGQLQQRPNISSIETLTWTQKTWEQYVPNY